MSNAQAASLVILLIGLLVMTVTAPALRLTARNYAFGQGHENELVKWISRVLGFILAVLGLVTFLQFVG